MQILGHSTNTASERLIRFLRKMRKWKSRINRRDWNCGLKERHNEILKNIVQWSTFIYWWASRDLNPGPDDYESVLSCLYRLILTYTVCYCLYNIRLLKVKPVLLSDTEYQAEIRLIDTYMDTYYLWDWLPHTRTCERQYWCL